MTDALMFHTPDGGDVEIVDGEHTMSNGLYTAVYLALFGGNDEDSGDDAGAAKQWWGNVVESEPTRRYRSRTQYVLQGLPATTGNLKALRDAVNADLDGLVQDGTLTEYSTTIAITGPKRARITVQVTANGTTYPFAYESAWEAVGA